MQLEGHLEDCPLVGDGIGSFHWGFSIYQPGVGGMEWSARSTIGKQLFIPQCPIEP